MPLALCVVLGQVDWVPYAIFGSINSVYGKQLGYGPRLRAQMVTGAALIAAVFAGTAVGVVAPGSWIAVVTMALLSLGGYLLSRLEGLFPVPSLFLVFAAGTLSSYRHHWSDLGLAVALPALSAALGIGLGQLGQWSPGSRRRRLPNPRPTPISQVLRTPGGPLALLTHLLGPLLAGGLALATHIGHPYWAAVTATVPLVGATLAAQVARATLRFVGTLAGVGVAFLLITGTDGAWALVVAVAVLQVFTELFVGRNYGIAVIAITPMALIMSHLGAPGPVWILVVDRIVETFIGAAVTLLVLVAVRPLRKLFGD